MAVVDTWVAETLIPYVERGDVILPVPDVLGTLAQIQSEIKELDDHSTPEDRIAGARYLAYVEALRGAYEAFITATRSSDTPAR